MNFGSQKSPRSRLYQPRIAAISLFTLAGMVVGVGAMNAQADQDPKVSGSQVELGSKQATNAQGSKFLRAKTGSESGVKYLVEHPSWRSSKAIITPDAKIPERTIEHTLYSQIVVGVRSEEELKAAIKQVAQAMGFDRAGANTYSRFLDETTVFVVDAGSVENAVNFANEITNLPGVEWAEVVYEGQNEAKALTADPSAPNQWHITNNYAGFIGNDHKIEAVHDSGITGAGIVVGIHEAGGNAFYHTPEGGDPTVPADRDIHPDLANQLNFDLSQPTFMFDKGYSHGVSVAGIVGAEGNNGLAGSGVAYGSQLASLRFGNSLINGTAYSHESDNIHIMNGSYGPSNESFPINSTGKYIVEGTEDDFEIDIPQVTHAGIARPELIGLDRGIRLGRGGKGRVFVFAAGNGSHFTGFGRLAMGNAISLPGIGVTDGAPQYGYLDINAVDSADTAPADGMPDAFLLDGTTNLLSRHSGTIGDRVEYNGRASLSRTFAIGSVGMSNAISGYSTTGTGVFASAYSQDSILDTEFTPAPPTAGWFATPNVLGISTLEQINGDDQDAGGGFPVDCNAFTFGPGNVNSLVDYAIPDSETCMFNGTSAAAPVASGIMALMLEANPSLTIRDMQHIIQQTSTVVNYDSNASYWPSVILDLGETDDDDPGPTPTFWSTNTADVRHSDEYGFGIMNAQAAVAAAQNWTPVKPLFVLNSGIVEVDDVEIQDATFEFVRAENDNMNINRLVPGERFTYDLACVRENFRVESVEIALTFSGEGVGDLLLALVSPQGTISPIALPRGDDGTYTNYTFTTYKNWNELSGGTWQLVMQDFRPNEESPEGTPRADPFDPDDLGLEEVTYLGPFGMPGNPDHEELSLVEFQLRIFATDEGLTPSEGCPVFNTSCPADLDGNGIVEVADIRMYIFWFLSGDPLADLNGDGDITYGDMAIYQAIWIPGFCDADDPRAVGGRPVTGGGISRPIGVIPGN